jgi:hypothetical protein
MKGSDSDRATQCLPIGVRKRLKIWKKDEREKPHDHARIHWGIGFQ